MKNNLIQYFFKFICVIYFTSLSAMVFGQQGFTLYSMSNMSQSHYLNPAFSPEAKGHFSFPGMGMHSFGVSFSGFNYAQLIRSRVQDDSLEIDLNNAVKYSAKMNFISTALRDELMSFGFKINRNYFSVSMTNRLECNFLLPGDLITFAAAGNGQFIGKRASYDGLSIHINSFMEYALGFNRVLGEKENFVLGARVKALSGISNVTTKKSKLGLYTDEDMFDLTLDGSLEMSSSGIGKFIDGGDTPDTRNILSNAYNFKNFGLAADLGFNFKASDKVALSASVTDIGFIKWKEDIKGYSTDSIDFSFQGLDAVAWFKDSTNTYWTELADSLEHRYVDLENSNPYTDNLFMNVFVGGKFYTGRSFYFGVALFDQIVNSNHRPGASLSANIKVKNWLALTVNQTYFARAYNNTGVGLCISPGPVQLYLITDNIMAAINQTHAKTAHFSFGLNFLIKNRLKNNSDIELGVI